MPAGNSGEAPMRGEQLWTRLRCSRCRYVSEHPGPVMNYTVRRRRMVNAAMPVRRPSAITMPVVDIAGAGAVGDVQILSTQMSGRAHSALVMQEPPSGTGVFVGVRVAVVVAVAVAVAVLLGVDVAVTQLPLQRPDGPPGSHTSPGTSPRIQAAAATPSQPIWSEHLLEQAAPQLLATSTNSQNVELSLHCNVQHTPPAAETRVTPTTKVRAICNATRTTHCARAPERPCAIQPIGATQPTISDPLRLAAI